MIGENELKELEKYGEVGLEVQKALLILGISQEEFDASAEAQTAYRKGQYRGEYAWRVSIFRGVKKGVPQMCKLYQSLVLPEDELPGSDNLEYNYEFTEDDEERPDGSAPAGRKQGD